MTYSEFTKGRLITLFQSRMGGWSDSRFASADLMCQIGIYRIHRDLLLPSSIMRKTGTESCFFGRCHEGTPGTERCWDLGAQGLPFFKGLATTRAAVAVHESMDYGCFKFLIISPWLTQCRWYNSLWPFFIGPECEYGENHHLIYRFRAGQLADLVGLGRFWQGFGEDNW